MKGVSLGVGLWVCNEKSRLKFSEMASIFLSPEFWRNIKHTYSPVPMLRRFWKHVLQEGEDGHGNQKHIDFCSSHDIRALEIL